MGRQTQTETQRQTETNRETQRIRERQRDTETDREREEADLEHVERKGGGERGEKEPRGKRVRG